MSFTFIQGAKNGDTASSATIVATFSSQVNANNLVIGSVATDLGGSPSVTITDDGVGGTWVTKVRIQFGEVLSSFYGYGWSVGPTNITANISAGGASDRAISVIEVSGQVTGDPIDGTNANGQAVSSPGTGTDALLADASNLTPSVNNCLVYGGVCRVDDYGNGTSPYSAGTNFTKPLSAEENVNVEIALASEYWIQTTATASKGPWTVSNGSGNYVANMMIFKPATGGGGSSPTLPQLERKTRGLNRGMYQAA